MRIDVVYLELPSEVEEVMLGSTIYRNTMYFLEECKGENLRLPEEVPS